MIDTMVKDGLVAVEVAWVDPGIWGGPQARTLACRYATVAKWVYANLHQGGKQTLFAAQGTSGGAAQIAFALAHYGLDNVIDLANLGGGPPVCPLCTADPARRTEPLLRMSRPFLGNPLFREPQLNYPATTVRFFLGDREPSPDIVSDANDYYGSIGSKKTMQIVPGTAHDIEETQAGVDAFIASVRDALKSRGG